VYDHTFVKDGMSGIKRTAVKGGAFEYICLSPNKIIYGSPDGNEKTLNRFVNGPLMGKIRSI
jgi:hypothetical protein